MNLNESKKGASLSFLERFEGKKSTISKEGLVHLFDQHYQQKIANHLITNVNSERNKMVS